MMRIFFKAISVIFRKLSEILNKLSDLCRRVPLRINRSRIVKKGIDRDLYQTKYGNLYWLNTTGYVDQCIIESGIFEYDSTQVVKALVKPGDVVLDVGANIGYYSVMLSKLVGVRGKVVCFEPTEYYGKVLALNIDANKLKNIEIIKIGLSDKSQELTIQIGASSATLHAPKDLKLEKSEKIKLMALDDFLTEHPLTRLDFIKIDVDGHEPFFLKGAEKTLEKYEPVILLEVNHLNYFVAGYTAWDFYEMLKAKNYHVYHEDGLVEITNQMEFLIKCGNFSVSANIVISRRKLEKRI